MFHFSKVIEIIMNRKVICSIIITAFVNVRGGSVVAYNVNDFQNIMYDCFNDFQGQVLGIVFF